MFDSNTCGTLFWRDEKLWNRTFNFKYIKVKITKQRDEQILGITKCNELFKFEIISNGLTQFLNFTDLSQY
jgi:hypothetical protein